MLALRCTQKLGIRVLLSPAYKNVTGAPYSTKDDDSSSSSSDDEKKPKKKVKTSDGSAESASQRLNRLLGSMQATSQLPAADFPRPGEANRRRKEAAKNEASSRNVITAAKNIASMLGDNDRKQTESELLAKLLGHSSSTTNTGVQEETKSTSTEKDINLSELIVGMKIDRRQQPQEPQQTRGEYVRRTLASRAKFSSERHPSARPQKHIKREAEAFTGSVNLYGGEPLGIFKNLSELTSASDILSTWSALNEKELILHAAHPPANYFEQMANWTEQGKVWRFPIDNEQDMREEIDVDFSEHIFLEQHLEPWCPNRGPIRHFMELVCVGLSKNPYITAQDKKDHIFWFRDYFEAKKDILKDLMSKETMENTKSISAP